MNGLLSVLALVIALGVMSNTSASKESSVQPQERPRNVEAPSNNSSLTNEDESTFVAAINSVEELSDAQGQFDEKSGFAYAAMSIAPSVSSKITCQTFIANYVSGREKDCNPAMSAMSGECKNSWAYAIVEMLACQLGRVGRKVEALSVEQLTQCRTPSGCKVGNTILAGLDSIASMGGIQSSRTYGNTTKKCNFNRGKAILTVHKAFRLVSCDDWQIRYILDRYGPIAVSINFRHRFDKSYSVIDNEEETKGYSETRSMALVGYGNGYWGLKNWPAGQRKETLHQFKNSPKMKRPLRGEGLYVATVAEPEPFSD